MARGSKKAEEMNELALGDQFSVPDVISVLDEKLKALKHVTDTKYRTSGVLDGIGDIKSETKINTLIRAMASVLVREETYNRAAAELGLTTFPSFEVNGCSSADWKHDIRFRIDVINHKETADKLTYYKDKMSTFLSEQDQKNMLMTEMANFLKNANI
jgi:hypothetical protein